MGKNWRRGKSKNIGVTKSNATSRRLLSDYARLGTWQAVAAKYGVSKAIAYRVALGYEPHRPAVRAALGLPALMPAPACPTCGVVHVSSRCPNKPKAARQPRYRPTVREVRGYAALVLALLSGAK